MGHDSDKQTSDDELTRSGYPRNYIRGQDGRVTVEAENDDYGRAYLETTILLGAPPPLRGPSRQPDAQNVAVVNTSWPY